MGRGCGDRLMTCLNLLSLRQSVFTRLHHRHNLIPVSNICEAVPRYLFLAPKTWRALKSWYTGGASPEQGFWRRFRVRLNKSSGLSVVLDLSTPMNSLRPLFSCL